MHIVQPSRWRVSKLAGTSVIFLVLLTAALFVCSAFCLAVKGQNRDPAALANMNRDDWYLLLVVLSKDDRQQATIMKNAEQTLNDMEESACVPDGRMFEQWAQHFGIKNLKEAEQFIPHGALYAVLINVMRKLRDPPGVEALYEQAKQAARVSGRTHMSMARTYCTMGLPREAIRVCEGHLSDSIDDVLGSRLIKKCGYDASDVQAAAVIFECCKRRGVADVLVYSMHRWKHQ
ncbi:hypothetical protein HKX48_004699 [Thoreauomyces humboldtii]|nr:hypothetical protein HKX48_004699 [Thoreauomyces humboldtii]